VFEKKNANTLPKHQPYNYTIDLEEGTQLPLRAIYNLSQDKLVALHEYFDENLKKGSFDSPNL
jgi:hypothetical protein